MRRILFALVVASAPLLGAACADEPDQALETPESSYDDELIDAEKTGKPSQKWIYNGPLPRLDQPQVVASLKSHTVRVTGLLPKGFAGPLPFYVETKPSGDRQKLTVVYPMATGAIDPSTGKAPAAAGTYSTLFAVAYTPTNDKAPWGGFPFVMYQAKRGIAFHGPITSVPDVDSTGDYEWRLYRGPVSHGCNRMAGEHIVEMSRLIGIDMTKPHTSSERFTLDVKTSILSDFDTFDGVQVDVDYPAAASVVRPTGATAKIYPTWLSEDFPRLVCAYRSDRPLGATHCDYAGDNRRDLATGVLLAEPTSKPWLGSSCNSNNDCAFDTGKGATSCSPGLQGAGVCTISCEGFCPDQAGNATTFCATFSDGKGRCVAKADPLNKQCATLSGTSAKLVSRYVGASTAKAAKATVCMPK